MPHEESDPAPNSKKLAEAALAIVDAPDATGGEDVRFFEQVKAIAERRAQAGWPGEDKSLVAVFVRVAYPRKAAASLAGSQPCADLGDTLSQAIFGRVHVLNFDASQGHSAPLVARQPGEVLEWVEQQSFRGDQIVVLYRDTLQLVERAGGAASAPTRKAEVRASRPDVSLEQLELALTKFHADVVMTPSQCPADVWKRKHASKYYPGSAPEKAIQGQLRTWLAAWWQSLLRAEVEDPIGIGRIDVRLLRPDPVTGSLTYWAIVELKIVKSFHYTAATAPSSVSNKENAEAVAEGVRQAGAFSINRSCIGVLEVYDMRKVKSPDPRQDPLVISALASYTPRPIVRLTPIFGTASHARRAGAA